MKYKVGDKVLVRNDLEHDKRYSDVRFDKEMEKYRGGQATITRVHEKFQTYEIDLDQGLYMWGDDMFEGLVYVLPTPATKVMKYKVGDKVQIRADLHLAGNWCGSDVAVVKDMLKMAGKLATIKAIRRNDRYDIEEDGGRWIWHESMIQGKAIPVRIGVSDNKVDIKTEGTPQKQVAEMFGCERKEVPDDYAIAGEPTLANDAVSHPSHYTDGRIECIDFIQDKKLDFARGNVVKYICRAGKKGGSKAKEIEDLKKAKQYCEFAIRQLEGRV